MSKDEKLKKEIQIIHDHPEYFFENYLGVELWGMQKEIVCSVRDNRKTTVRSCHGSGKTFTLARTALWFLSAFVPSIVINTAPTYRQVANQFWREFRKAHGSAKIPLGGELKKTEFNIDADWFALGVSTRETAGDDVADKFQGFHGKHILIIVDEASGVAESIMEAIDGALSGGDVVRLVYIGNPTRLTGTFADSFTDPNFNKFHISAFDTPNFILNNIKSISDLTEKNVKKAKTYIAGLATPEWAFNMLKKYGKDSDVWRVRVEGNFPSKESDTLISIQAVESAMNEEREEYGEEHILGVDVARYGEDYTTFVARTGNYVCIMDKYQGKDTMETAGLIKQYLIDNPEAHVHIDSIGVGGGVVDRLKEQDDIADRVHGINTALPAKDKEKYVNTRAEGWDDAKEWLKTGILERSEDWLQLAQPRYKFQSNGKMQIESKEDMKKRRVKSPDIADALVLTLIRPQEEEKIEPKIRCF